MIDLIKRTDEVIGQLKDIFPNENAAKILIRDWQSLAEELAGALEEVVDYYKSSDGTIEAGPQFAYSAEQALARYKAVRENGNTCTN